MLPCICSVTDHGCRENVATKKWHTSCSVNASLMFLPHFDFFCDLLLNRGMATLNQFVLYNKEIKNLTLKSFKGDLSSNRSWIPVVTT